MHVIDPPLRRMTRHEHRGKLRAVKALAEGRAGSLLPRWSASGLWGQGRPPNAMT